MSIDYKAIGERLERQKAAYDKPHPWETEFSTEDWTLSRKDYKLLDRKNPHECRMWNTCWRINNLTIRFHAKHRNVSPLQLYTMLLQGQINPPHKPECPRCNVIREQRKLAKDLKLK